ncbi:fatty acid desaturase [Ferruginivarius sediminum]|uniref:Fatty acid desaturase n=1 Tax=Ferruginivarius sediminum TaxID=2661937 RepID=A0A369TLR6_9PROT|nr:fatty acid desaturase [Ferruginivarius sediminum]RDD63856.1 fatty acid desaturase [Ferruginivarius sediminum]
MTDTRSVGDLDKRALKALARRSDLKGLLQLAQHATALGATGVLIWMARGTVYLPAAWLAHGLLLIFLFAPLHECIHRTAFRTRWLNDAVAWLCAAPLLLPPAYFRAFHLAHHRWTQDSARDPELISGKPHTRAQYAWHLTGLPYWWERIETTARQAMGRASSPFLSPRDKPMVIREARVLIAVIALAVGGSVWLASDAVFVYVAIPALLGQPFLRAYLLAEHTGCPFVPQMLRNSRTTHTSALVRRLAWNMPYHSEHHAYPAIPFHALPDAHRLLRERIETQADGYVAVHHNIISDLK